VMLLPLSHLWPCLFVSQTFHVMSSEDHTCSRPHLVIFTVATLSWLHMVYFVPGYRR
jgi:hypothetical protein